MNITIVDDDVEFADNTAHLLKARGHSVSVFYTVAGAAAKLREHKPDLLILDVMFPDNPAAGFDLARELRKDRSLAKLPVILLTGVNQEFPMGFSAKDIDPEWMPVQGFLEKPASVEQLLALAAKLVSRK